MASTFPSLEEIYDDIEKFVLNNPSIAQVKSLGSSREGRAIKAVCVTDDFPVEEKEIALIVCGRHGNELGGPVVGQALLDWLASDRGSETRKKQLVIVIPAANPDGLFREKFHAPSDSISETEKLIIRELTDNYKPDAVVDVHSLWFSDLETVISAHTSSYGEDDLIHRMISSEMVERAALEGYPFLNTDLESIFDLLSRLGYNNFFCEPFYENFHSLVFGMEVNHFVLSPEEVGKSGALPLVSLLEVGNRPSLWEYAPGYPNRVLIGDLSASIRATGKNAAERRESRSQIWRNRRYFTKPRRETPDRHTVKIMTEYSGKDLSCDFSLCCRIRSTPVIHEVRLNGERADRYTCRDGCSTYIFVDIPSVRGTYELSIEI